MIDTVIVGSGLSGLALADRLLAGGRQVHLFEARERLGGRIRTQHEPVNDLHVDLGPSWFWPETQPRIAELIAGLGLASFPQYDSGAVLQLTDPEKGAENFGAEPIHAGAHRVEGGVGRLVSALAARLPADCRSFAHVLKTVEDRGDHVRLRFQHADGPRAVDARRVVLALPPRLLIETVTFAPDLPAPLTHVMRQTETWMAAQAKAVSTFPDAGWRAQGISGNAFIAHERAVLAEVFDQSAASGRPGALGGFVALDPDNRASFDGGMPTLLGNQLAQLFGSDHEDGVLVYHDWARERFTCSDLDRQLPHDGQRRAAHPLLRRAQWGAKLLLAGSETAHTHPGHMEGALDAAHRVAGQIARSAVLRQAAGRAGNCTADALATWFETRGAAAFDLYRQSLNRQLSRQEADGATRLAASESIAALFEDALDVVAALEFPDQDLSQPATRAEIIEPLKPRMRATLNRFIGEVMGFNRASCALRNFPDEHRLPETYMRQILQDAGRMGQDFLNEVDAVLASGAEAA